MEILITGATSGIGRALASGLASDGHTLHLHGRDPERLSNHLKTLSSNGCGHTMHVADLAQSAAIRKMCVAVDQACPAGLDLIINNAFGKLEKPLPDLDPSEIGPFLQASVAAPAQIVHFCLPALHRAQAPRIVNIVADWGFPMHNIMTGPSMYVAAKYGVHGLGAALQRELAPLGIRTTNICPGVVAAEADYNLSAMDFDTKYGVTAIHPRTLVDAVRFITSAAHAHVRSIVLSPNNSEYNGL